MGTHEDIFNLTVMGLTEEQDLKPTSPEVKDDYERQRSDWTSRTTSMAKKVKSMAKLAELEVEAFSNRGLAVEAKHAYVSMLTDMNKAYKILEAEKIKEYSAGKKQYSVDQMRVVIAADISGLWGQIEHLKNHVQFMDEVVRTIDNIIYGVKYRIEIQKYLDPTK